MKHPKISVITPSFNQADYLEQTICSVLDQNYPNLEYIIIDGGSTDKSPEIIKKYTPYLKYWVSEPDKGQSDAIVKGYRQASGEVINWLNSDDYYNEDALHKVGEAFQDPSINVFCGISRVFGNGHEYHTTGTDIYWDNLEKTIGWARIDQPETFMRKSVWDAIGAVDPRFHYFMDKELWIRYLQTFGLDGIKKSNELLVHFRHHPNSKTVSQQTGFHSEGFNLFYSIALENGLQNEASFFENNFGSVHISLNHKAYNVDFKKVMNYFLLYQLEEAYAVDDRKRVNLINKYLDYSVLSVEDQRRYKNVLWRSKLIPVKLKRWWNKA